MHPLTRTPWPVVLLKEQLEWPLRNASRTRQGPIDGHTLALADMAGKAKRYDYDREIYLGLDLREQTIGTLFASNYILQ